MSIKINPELDPHLSQYENVPIITQFSGYNRLIHPEDPTMEYQAIKKKRSAFHWGQRKLIISEIEFLTKYADMAQTLIYVGAGSRAIEGVSLGGIHIGYLSKMFSKIDFHLYDPTDFGVIATDHIHLYKQYFSDDDAQDWRDKNIPLLFISDIRTVGDDEPDKEKYANAILSDMNNQLKWAQILMPTVSMVKFKLPYGDVISVPTTTVYPKGDNYLPVWGRQTTTETRLIFTDPNDLVNYDNKNHEEVMAYFNNRTLLSYYEHDYNIKGFDHCYSCRSEFFILEQYVKKIWGEKLGNHKKFLQKEVENLSTSITKFLTNNMRTFSEQYDHVQKQSAKFKKI